MAASSIRAGRRIDLPIFAAASRRAPVIAGSDDNVLANQTGDDPTQPLGKIELLDRFTTTPGPARRKARPNRSTPTLPSHRIETPFRITPQWELAFRVEVPVVSTNPVTPQNPSGQVITGFGNVLTQGWLVYEITPRWAIAAGAQVIAPTATNGVASNAWEEVTGAVVRVMLPELSEGSYSAPQVRYGVDFGGNDEGPMLRQLRLMPTLNINLPHNLFLTFFPSPNIRWNYGTPVHGQTGRFFLPLNFMIGWKPTPHTITSAEFGIPIIKDFPAYTFKTQSTRGLFVLNNKRKELHPEDRFWTHSYRFCFGAENSARSRHRPFADRRSSRRDLSPSRRAR